MTNESEPITISLSDIFAKKEDFNNFKKECVTNITIDSNLVLSVEYKYYSN